MYVMYFMKKCNFAVSNQGTRATTPASDADEAVRAPLMRSGVITVSYIEDVSKMMNKII